jgi:hypothetical protein
MKTEIRKITPIEAKRMLELNTMNRIPRKRCVDEYAREMEQGLWNEETGEAIKIAFDGTLLDGQQRLLALIKANTTLSFLVISGLNKETFKVLDTGAKRTAGDIFFISGIENAKNLAAGITRYMILKKGSIKLSDAPRYSISATELMDIYNERIKYWVSAVSMAEKWYHISQRILTTSEYLGLYSFLWDIDNNDSFKFIDSLANGVDLELNNPIKQLRERLIFSKINPKFNLPNYYRTGMIFKAWNLFRKKETLKFLKFTDQENFPIPE